MSENSQNDLVQMVKRSTFPLLLCDHSLQVLAYSQSFYKSLGYFDDDIHTLFDANALSRIKRAGKDNKSIRCKTRNVPFQLQININWLGQGEDSLMLCVVEKNYIHPATDSIALAYSCMDQMEISMKMLTAQLNVLPKSTEGYDSIETKSKILKRDFRNLNDCISILTDTLLLKRVDTGLNRIIRQAIYAARPHAQSRKVEILYHEPKDTIWINCDLKHMIRAIGDCLYNVLFFSQQDHHVQIHITEQLNTCTIEMVNPLFKIPDHGIPNLFTRQTVLPQENDHAGLYFANAILLKHNGKLEFDNSPRYGYKLILTLPKSSITTIQFNDIDDSAITKLIDSYLEYSFFDL